MHIHVIIIIVDYCTMNELNTVLFIIFIIMLMFIHVIGVDLIERE